VRRCGDRHRRPETKGVDEAARACVRMAVAMQQQMVELQQEWRASGFELAHNRAPCFASARP
jgi:hypothetical protein